MAAGFEGRPLSRSPTRGWATSIPRKARPRGGHSQQQLSDPGSFELVLSRKVAPVPGPRPSLVRTITSVTIRASNDDNTLDGTELLTVSRADQFHRIESLAGRGRADRRAIHFRNLWAFRRPDDFMQRRFQYYISVFSAVALTTAMIVLIAISLKNINTRGGELGGGHRNVVLSMGFAHVFKGTYVRGIESRVAFLVHDLPG